MRNDRRKVLSLTYVQQLGFYIVNRRVNEGQKLNCLRSATNVG